MKEIPPMVIRDLIRLGAAGEMDASEERHITSRLGPFDWVDRLGWGSWDAVTGKLSLRELHCLACGLVRAEKIEGWGGGSVAGAIWVFRVFQRRFPQQVDGLAEWMLANSDNPWVPFGGNRGNARSLAALEHYREAQAGRRRAKAQEEELRKHLGQVRASVRHRIASERQSLQTATSSARKRLLEELAELPLHKRIEHIAWDDTHPLSFFPVDLVEGSLQQICETDAVSLKLLVEKAASQRHGQWRTWMIALREASADNPATASALGLEPLYEVKAPEKKSKGRKKKTFEAQLELEEEA